MPIPDDYFEKDHQAYFLPDYDDDGLDPIDFPCSVTFISGLAAQGLTRDFPPGFYSRPAGPIEELQSRLDDLEEQVTKGKHVVEFRVLHRIKEEKREVRPEIRKIRTTEV